MEPFLAYVFGGQFNVCKTSVRNFKSFMSK